MLLKALAGTAILGVALAMSGAARADDDLIDATNPEKLAEIIRGFGSARMDKAADETPAIRGRIEGNAFSVYFYGCNDRHEACQSINLTASWNMAGATSLDQVNTWNADKRFGRAYVDDQGSAVVETDINLSGSVTYENMEGNIDWWRIIMADFKANVIDASSASQDEGEGKASPVPETPATTTPAPAAEAAPAQPSEPAPAATPATPAAPAEPASAATSAEGAAPQRSPFSIPRKPNPGN